MAAKPHPVPIVKTHSHANRAKNQEEIVKKFSQNFRKHMLMENRETARTHKVQFNPETVETSIGGSQTPGQIKDSSNSSIQSVHLDFSAQDAQKREQNSEESLSSEISISSEQSTIIEESISDISTSSKDTTVIKTEISVSKMKPQFNCQAEKDKKDEKDKNTKPKTLHPNGTEKTINVKSTPLAKSTKAKTNGALPDPFKRESLQTATPSKRVSDLRTLKKGITSTATNGNFHTPERKSTPLDLLRDTRTPDVFNTVAFETPRPMRCSNGDLSGSFDNLSMESDASSMTVAVRVRPFSTREEDMEDHKCIISMIDNETTVTNEKNTDVHRFVYDYSFWSFDKKGGDFADQEHVYCTLAQPMLSKAFEGYNTCLFAYGQTGSGKSYCMMGHGEEIGIIPRFCEELFGRIEVGLEGVANVNVEISFFEIYNEKIHDLLGPSNKDKTTGKRACLKVREHPVLGPYVEGLSSYVVKSFEDIKGWLSVGNKHRATAATGMNDKSSRSHSVFTMVMTQTRIDMIEEEEHEHSITSKINLVDLAGSERQSLAKTTGDRLREGASINKSLHTLGKVISHLATIEHTLPRPGSARKKVFVPYRDSVLTWLLKESLGGNSKTAMLATISPAGAHMEETLSTLRYARQARSIINSAKVNEDPKARLIRELKAEIERLKSQTGCLYDDDAREITTLRHKLKQKENEMDEMTKSWQERLKKSEERKAEESRLLEKSGIALKIDNKLPNLVNLNEDPQLSEMLLYIIRVGESKVGRLMEQSDADIQLTGPLIADNHCTLKNTGTDVILIPHGDAPTYVNGDHILEPVTLHHGDRVILGGNQFFRLNHPVEVQKGRKSLTKQPKDFEFAKQELINVQNERLEEGLEQERLKYEAEMKKQREEAEKQMKTEVEKTKQSARQKLQMQRDEYEDRLTELEQELSDQKSKKYESEQQRLQMQTNVRKLEQQKTMLESELLANRTRLQMEAAACDQVVIEARATHNRIIDTLTENKQKIQAEVIQLEERKERRKQQGMTPRTPARTPSLRGGGDSGGSVRGSSKKDLYKTVLSVREANKIAQHLHKDTVFSREDVKEGDSSQMIIKVTNNKLAISTFWTMEKFEDRLLQMKELFQGEGPAEEDASTLFYDPNDQWEKEDRLSCSPGISPAIMKNLRKQMKSPTSPLTPRIRALSFDTNSPASPHTLKPPQVDINAEEDDEEEDQPSSVVFLCREMISCYLEQHKTKESLSDKILHVADTMRGTMGAMLKGYQTHAEENNTGNETFVESELAQGCCIQLAHRVSLLLELCSVWRSQHNSSDSETITVLFEDMASTARALANNMTRFMQGCENDISNMVSSSDNQLQTGVYELCRQCGELALATGTTTASLKDTRADNTTVTLMDDEDEEQDETLTLITIDLKQHFLSGCDQFIDKSLQGAIRAIDGCKQRINHMEQEATNKDNKSMSDEVLRKVDETVAASKSLMEKLQSIQTELDSTLQENSSMENSSSGSGDRSSGGSDNSIGGTNYYYRNYQRCQALITHVANLTDGVTFLTQASEALIKDTADGSYRRLYRCAEMIQKSTSKILQTSSSMGDSGGLSSILSSSSSASQSLLDSSSSLLSDSQVHHLHSAGQEIKLATNALILAVKKEIDNEVDGAGAGDGKTGGKVRRSPSKSKRMLPLSPQRSNSFRASPGHVKKMAALVDMAGKGSK